MNKPIKTGKRVERLVSIVIPTLDSASVIRECLESIKTQTYRYIEIIVVDGYSEDNTVEIAKRYCCRVFSHGPDQSRGRVFGAPYQRNFGAKKARGEFVYLVDSDMRLTPKVVEECVSKIEKENADAAIVPEISYGEGFWTKCRALEKLCYIGDEFVEAARFVRKEVWDRLGGWDVTLGGFDDFDFQHRLNENGYITVRIKSPVMHYDGKLSLSKHLAKKFIYGKTFDKYIKKHGEYKDILLKQYALIRPAFLRNWRILVKDPIHTLGLIVMKALEYITASMGFLSSKFTKREIVVR